MNKRDIDVIVNKLIKKAGSNDLKDIISYLGIKIKKYNGKSFYLKNKNNKYIYLDKNTPEEKQDFALAHELGHSILHNSEIGQSFIYRVKSQQIENEANYFAFKILGKKIDPTYNFTINQYANMLNVNEEVIEYVVEG
ncbi:ImmA/IrrE family metallo-endopeptidase [Anaerococcus sp.]|uniref:ImmA/IrrE family metallo-endopeptidase n=1 Tax=Anaerococcus sp. TaxID=1872515 RepID=UPI002A914173|nr:ImmA/IrrE family metallo-endopeptidase [Anaerococcus sp.]MDY6127584.1 ImmA/IrrE family metallo-endopeptidase [Anaerococcus sp.]